MWQGCSHLIMPLKFKIVATETSLAAVALLERQGCRSFSAHRLPSGTFRSRRLLTCCSLAV
jgi:hypothetical protein